MRFGTLWMFGSVALLLLGCFGNSLQAFDAKKHPHHHLHHALWELRDARKELKESGHHFGGHKEKALLAIRDAIKQIEVLLKNTGEKAQGEPTRGDLHEQYKKYPHHPHLHHALHELKHAHRQVKEAKHDFGGHRDAALRDIDFAMQQIELCLKNPPKKV